MISLLNPYLWALKLYYKKDIHMEENVLNQVKFIKNENDINLFLF